MAPSDQSALRPHSRTRRIAVTGGPGAGKTSVLSAAKQAFGDRVVPVPEVATLMFSHMFPKAHTAAQRCAIQHAIFYTQLSVEDFHDSVIDSERMLLCDRGTPDGGGYWPAGADDFFVRMGTTLEHELSRYEAVVFLETAAAGGLSIAEGNAVRSESPQLAIQIDERLRDLWSRHPRFAFVPHRERFDDKIAAALVALRACIPA